MPITIRTRLLLLVLSVLLPAIVAGGWLVARAHAAERSALERELRDTTRALSQLVERELVQRAAIARVLALSSGLADGAAPTAAELESFGEQARRAVNGMKGWVELVSADTRWVDTRLEPAIGGRPRGADAPALLDAAGVGTLERGADPAELYAPIVQPVLHDGRTVLNVAITVLPGELQAIIDGLALPPGWTGAVVDRRGVIVARLPGGGGYAGRPAAEELRRRLAAAREGVFEAVSADGGPVSGYFSTSAQGWTTITTIPRAALIEPPPAGDPRLAAAAVVVLGSGIAAALWLARRIAAPVGDLQESARRLQAGQPVTASPTGVTEFDAVAGAMADASREVQRQQAALERRVADAAAAARAAEQHVSRVQRAEALGRLTGGVAHDFNNLLGVISNSAYLIQRHPAADELRVPLAAVMRSVESGSRLTQHLARIAGRHPSHPTRVDLASSLPETVELLKLVLGKRITIELGVAPSTPQVAVDPAELELALINLALNARDALPDGGKVWLGADDAGPDDTEGLPDGRYVLITFSDDGPGIDEAIVDRVFEPFFTTHPVGQGTGLGLSQVQGFATQAGGRARLASTPGVGTAVMLLLPAAPATAPTADAPAHAAVGNEQRLNGVRVLLVEDNGELAGVTAELLATYGCRVDTAHNPAQALVLLDSGRGFDVVLSDVMMPGEIDGLGLAREIRHRWPSLPVVLISGNSTALGAERAFTVLNKPCTPEQLTDALADAIDGRRRAGAIG